MRAAVWVVVASVVLLGGCASTPGPTVGVKPLAGQLESFRSGKAFVSSPQANTFVTVSLLHDTMRDQGRLPPIMVTVSNMGSQPLDVKHADFSLTAAGQPVRLVPKREILEAQARDQRIGTALMVLGGTMESAGAASRRSEVSGTASTTYRSQDGRNLGTGESTFRGTVNDPGARRAAADAAADRTGAEIARVQAAGNRQRAESDRLLLERETVFPGQSATFALVPEKYPGAADKGVAVEFTLRAQLAGDQHVFSLVKP